MCCDVLWCVVIHVYPWNTGWTNSVTHSSIFSMSLDCELSIQICHHWSYLFAVYVFLGKQRISSGWGSGRIQSDHGQLWFKHHKMMSHASESHQMWAHSPCPPPIKSRILRDLDDFEVIQRRLLSQVLLTWHMLLYFVDVSLTSEMCRYWRLDIGMAKAGVKTATVLLVGEEIPTPSNTY